MWNWLGIGQSSASAEAKDQVQEDSKESQQGDDTDLDKKVREPGDTEKDGSKDGEKDSSRQPTDQDDVHLNKVAKDVAKNVGSFLYGFATAATETASKLKESVDDKLEKANSDESTDQHTDLPTIIGDFQRENEKFIKEKHAKRKEEPVPPWVGYHEEQLMKTQILALSTDERNFLRDPPSGVDFHFDLDIMMPVAIATLKEDRNLTDMRFQLVPKKVSEAKFWRNYFYRVSLIKQSSQLLTLTQSGSDSKRSSTSSSGEKIEIEDAAPMNKMDTQGNSDDLLLDTNNDSSGIQQGHNTEEKQQKGVVGDKDVVVQEDTEDLKDWEKELSEELQEFEFVSEDQTERQEPDPSWEKEIEDMLGISDDDEKQEKT